MIKRQRFRMRIKWFKLAIIICLLCVLGNAFVNNVEPLSFLREIVTQVADSNNAPLSSEWNLIIVNRENSIPSDYNVTLTELANGQKVDSRIYPDLQEMFNGARVDGIYPIVRSGYRTKEEQQEIFTEKVQAYINEENSKDMAKKMAEQWVALPGASEHQLGIAVDINADKTQSSNEEVYKWLAENAYQYGFILRYPQGKENITGASYEPWHYRYVGKEVAKEIFNKQICLEEYFEENP